MLDFPELKTARFAEAYPFFPAVPTEWRANLEYRIRIREAALHDRGLQRDLIQMCQLDTLFFFSVFLEVVEPRERDPQKRIRPFVPRPAQQLAIFAMDETWGVEDAIWEKSRGEGATYLVCGRMLKSWLWEPMFKGGIASKTEKDVDAKDDLSAVMPKIDYQLSRLPFWMRPDDKHIRRTSEPPLIGNLLNGSAIRGYACSDDLGTGGRITVWLWDEMAKFKAGSDQLALDSTQGTSNCRMMVSTYSGITNQYAKIARNPDSTIRKIRLPWWHNPERNKGLFRLNDASQPTPVDPAKFGELPRTFLDDWPRTAESLANRGYRFDRQQLLSPWYVKECLRPGTMTRSMAQEYDMRPQGTESDFFQPAAVEEKKFSTARPPLGRYSLQQNEQGEWRLVSNPNGPLRLWIEVQKGKPLLFRSCVIGCDISQGVTTDRSTNSVAAIFGTNGEQAGEYVCRDEDPTRFAETVDRLGRLFAFADHDAFVVWEHEGSVATRFFKRLDELGYRSFYRRSRLDADGKELTAMPGVVTSGQKDVVIGELRTAYLEGRIIIRSAEGHDELLQFVYDINGKLINVHEKNADDPSGVGRNHADRGMAYAMARIGIDEGPAYVVTEREQPHPDSIAGRRQQLQQRLRALGTTRI